MLPSSSRGEGAAAACNRVAGEFPTPPTTWYYGLLPMVDADETKEAAVE